MQNNLEYLTLVTLSQNNDLGQLSTRIAQSISANISGDLTDAEIHASIVNALYQYFEDTTPGNPGPADYDYLKNIGMKLADTYKTSVGILKGSVTKEVKSLSEEIFSLAAHNAQERLQVCKIDGNLKQAAKVYTTLEVDPSIAEMITPALKTILQQAGITTVDKVGRTNFRYLLKETIETSEEFVSPESAERISEQLFEMIKTESNNPFERDIAHAMVNESAYYSLIAKVFHGGNLTNGISSAAIKNALSYLKAYASIGDKLKFRDLDILDRDIQLLEHRKNRIGQIQVFAATMLLLAQSYYADALVISHDILNKHKVEEFYKMGGTLEDITGYLRLNHNQDKDDALYSECHHYNIPPAGISFEQFVRELPETKMTLGKKIEGMMASMESIRHTAMCDTFRNTMLKYVRTAAETNNIPSGMTDKQFIERSIYKINKAQQLLSTSPDNNMEDVLHNFILDTWYSNTLVSTIYHRLGARVVRELTRNDSLDDIAINKLHLAVQADIVADYAIRAFAE